MRTPDAGYPRVPACPPARPPYAPIPEPPSRTPKPPTYPTRAPTPAVYLATLLCTTFATPPPPPPVSDHPPPRAGQAILENMNAEERLMRNIPKRANKVGGWLEAGSRGVVGSWAGYGRSILNRVNKVALIADERSAATTC